MWWLLKKKLIKESFGGEKTTTKWRQFHSCPSSVWFHACFKAPENLTILLLSKKRKGKRELGACRVLAPLLIEREDKINVWRNYFYRFSSLRSLKAGYEIPAWSSAIVHLWAPVWNLGSHHFNCMEKGGGGNSIYNCERPKEICKY